MRQKLFDISSKSSRAMLVDDELLPPRPTSCRRRRRNRDYQAGFTAAMMLKDLKLAQDAAKAAGATTPLGRGRRRHLFALCRERGRGARRLFRASSASFAVVEDCRRELALV